jgi:hypothetical protein
LTVGFGAGSRSGITVPEWLDPEVPSKWGLASCHFPSLASPAHLTRPKISRPGAVTGALARSRVRGRGRECLGAVADAWARLRVRGRHLAQLLNVMPRVRFRSVETGEDYADTLEKVKFTSLAWTHDNKVSSG